MKQSFSLFLLFFIALSVKAQVQLTVDINRKKLNPGDTLITKCRFQYNDVALAAATLHVWIENSSGTKIWKYRYPLINGESLFHLIIGDSLPAGNYAINYLVQPQFLNVTGRAANYESSMNGISLLITSVGGNYSKAITPDSSGNFKTGKMVFADTALFTFTPNNKKGGELKMKIETLLDSVFNPIAIQTKFISIGNLIDTVLTAGSYQFNKNHFYKKAIELSEVIVTADVKAKKLKEFQKQNVSTRFKGISRDFNGFNNEELLQSKDVFVYLMKKLTALEIIPKENGYIILRKGSYVDIFLDERRVSPFELQFLFPGDVALIKIFDPGTGPTGGYGGSLAIYTKREVDKPELKERSVFSVFGFNTEYVLWQ